MRRSGSASLGRHGRGFARGKLAAGLAIGIGAAGVGAFGPVSGCVDTVDMCDPSIFPDGVKDPAYIRHCADPDAGSDAGDAGDAGDAPADAPISAPACQGQCAPLGPLGWARPVLVWMGPEPEAPPCPEAALKLAYEGHADLHAPNECGACQCDPPAGSCHLPTKLTASSMSCPGTDPGAAHTPFDPPVGWGGGCTSHDAVPAGQLCDGGPCVQSLTLGPLIMNEAACTPTQGSAPGSEPVTFGAYARACIGETYGSCGTSLLACVPPAPPGFRHCISREGDQGCSDSLFAPYTEKYVFFASIHDTRGCTPCTCGSPVGSTCSASISIFTDDKCAEAPDYVATIDSSGPACYDVVAGVALGSKSATEPVYAPGACEAGGGEPTGSAEPADPVTFCCTPPL